MLKRLTMTMAVVVAAATIAGVSPATADSEAAVLACSGSSCNGKDPNAEGCATTATPREIYPAEGRYTLQLRAGAGCRAFWGRITRDDCSLVQGMAHLRVQRRFYELANGWRVTHTYYRIQRSVRCDGGVGWTHMVGDGANDNFRACFSNYITTSPSSIPDNQWTCTAWW
ncbi:DUF2690 domain-containing protein [Nonomuraea sp. NPDC049421]|uniref:DUF2690 domain-containing protein n=1 Tax=Nonomuraea sp. NPDC049421 TaxID=3155275 RepID=UPI003439DC71